MIFQNEQQILKIVRYVPSLFLVSVSLIILLFLYYENIKTFQYQKDEIQKNHIIKSKELIKERVESVYHYIVKLQKSTEEDLKISLKEELNKAYSVINSIYKRNKDKDPELVKKLIKDSLRDLRFNNGRGYFFIHDKSKFASTMHPIMPSIEGRSSYNVRDAKGKYIIREMHKILKEKDEAFYEWYWYKPMDRKTQYKKIGFIKNFTPFNWFIGTGEHVVDFEKQQKKEALEEISNIKYNSSGYIFIINYDGELLAHPIKENVGTIITKKENYSYVQDIIELAKNGNGYIDYLQTKKPKTSISARKTSYIRGLKNWPWVIGTGFYENEVKEIISRKKEELNRTLFAHMKNTLIVSVILTFALLIVSLYLEKIIKRKFKKYNDEINKHLNEKMEQQNILAQQAKMAAMGDMIGNIAHQWRQPLSSITTSASSILLQSELDLLDKKSLEDGLNTINKRAIYLSNTIDDFRNFFNTEKTSSTFELQKTINESISIISAKLNNQNIKIIKNIQVLEVENLKNEFMQVIINILNNAKDALEEKEGEKFIFIDIYKQDDEAIIKIKDNAGGIKKDIIDKIFEPYFTTKHQSQGTGIGLFMSKQIVSKNLLGDLRVKNSTYKYLDSSHTGAEFTIFLPID